MIRFSIFRGDELLSLRILVATILVLVMTGAAGLSSASADKRKPRPGSVNAFMQSSKESCQYGLAHCWEYRVKAAMAGWPRGKTLRIHYSFTEGGDRVATDADNCLSTNGCIRHSQYQMFAQRQESRRNIVVCINVAVHFVWRPGRAVSNTDTACFESRPGTGPARR